MLLRKLRLNTLTYLMSLSNETIDTSELFGIKCLSRDHLAKQTAHPVLLQCHFKQPLTFGLR